MRSYVNKAFAIIFGTGVLLCLCGLLGWSASLNLGLGWLAAAVITSGFHPGDKTKLQMLFGSLGTATAVSIVGFALNPWLWAAVAVFAFLVFSMKLDGGDDTGA